MRTLDGPARRAAEAVSGQRLWDRLTAMSAIGRIEEVGVNRAALSHEDIEARALLIGWAEARGFAVEVDETANLFVRRAGQEAGLAPLVAGSHMDSQPRGGRFDGIWGVLAAFEALEAIEDSGIGTRRPLEAVAWTNEEGGRFAPGCMGSAAYTGASAVGTFAGVTDADGVSFASALERTLAATPGLPRRPLGTLFHAFLEPHIEQGPVLETEGRTIGVVDGIQGTRWLRVTLTGENAHAGTAPLATRKDPMRAAVRVIAALQEALCDPDDVLRFTVGRIEAEPGSYNTVPSRVTFTVDLRHPEPAVLNARQARLSAICARLATPCDVEIEQTFLHDPIRFPANIVDVIEAVAANLGHPSRRMPSGAFHDAAFLAPFCPTGMIFIPCRGGISHSPAEWAEPEHCAAGAAVLAAALVALDRAG